MRFVHYDGKIGIYYFTNEIVFLFSCEFSKKYNCVPAISHIILFYYGVFASFVFRKDVVSNDNVLRTYVHSKVSWL